MVMGKDGQKLSKRHGATAVREFRKAGYLPEAVINYISLIGWSLDGEREFFSKEDLERLFTLDKINKAPGVFDYKKLEWFNGQYIRAMEDGELMERILPFLVKEKVLSDPPTTDELDTVKRMIPLAKERMKFIPDAAEVCRFAFVEPEAYEAAEMIAKKMDAVSTLEALRAGRDIVESMKQVDDEEAEERFRLKSEELGFKLGQMLSPLRVAITGSSVSPPLFGSIRLIGIDKALGRIDRGIALLESEVA
jgi:glutamyl-tRNA synthetase